MDPKVEKPHVSGFVSLIGRPNAGKSTLMNALLGTKLAIVADKPQTTRTLVQGVWTTPEAQVAFLDTPGIHEPKNLLHKRMLEKVREALEGRDLIVFVVDASREFGKRDEQALEWLQGVDTPVLLALNKLDLMQNKGLLLILIDEYRKRREFAEFVPVSAVTGEGLSLLRNAIISRLPEGPAFFPEDYLTDRPERFLAAELIREKILLLTGQEVPHAVAVLVEKWEDTPRKDGSILTRVNATIHVERAGQKAILIGERGSMLKRIGSEARHDIEVLIDRKVYLELFVRVSPEWRQKAQFLNELDSAGASST